MGHLCVAYYIDKYFDTEKQEERIITFISSASNWRWIILLTLIYPIFVVLLSNILKWTLL
jgi:hypothetical protein